MAASADVLVVGAGPTGLALALQATLVGATVRVVDRRPAPREWAPALAVQPRTLEALAPIGVADELVSRGVSTAALHVHTGDHVARGRLHDLHLPPTDYPFLLFVPQPDVEAVLRARLHDLGLEVEWGRRLADLDQHDDSVAARLVDDRSAEAATVGYLVGCDGADSTVRRRLGVGFTGAGYRRRVLVADVAATSALVPGAVHAFVGADGIAFAFPLPEGTWRVIVPAQTPGTGSTDPAAAATGLTGGRLELGPVLRVDEFTLQHRLAASYRAGRVFLAGDAAHVHSPAGAQGMNTGIQDAANLGWKLALAARQGTSRLLDTYEVERRPVARRAIRLTHRAFAVETSSAAWLRLGRRWASSPIARVVVPRPALVGLAARAVSGLDIRYRRGALGDAPTPPGLPPVGSRASRLGLIHDPSHFLLIGFGTVAVSSVAEELVRRARGAVTCAVSSATPGPWSGAHLSCLVRPDGHIAVWDTDPALGGVAAYLDYWLAGAPAPGTGPPPPQS